MLPLSANIDAQIEAIQNASIEKHFKLMNAFKKEVLSMHEKERIDAIKKLKSITQSKHSKRALEELKDHEKKSEIDSINENEIEEHIENETEEYIEDEHDD